MQKLQREYALEQDPDRKRKILDQMLALIQEAWEQFFMSLAEKDNPQQFLRFVGGHQSHVRGAKAGTQRTKHTRDEVTGFLCMKSDPATSHSINRQRMSPVKRRYR
jgi:hypothetical protein